MTGPEHYREAEQLLAEIQRLPAMVIVGHVGSAAATEMTTHSIAAAQVHATLALAAATAEPIAQSYDGTEDTTIPRAWSGAIS